MSLPLKPPHHSNNKLIFEKNLSSSTLPPQYIPGCFCEGRIRWWRSVSELRLLIDILMLEKILPHHHNFLQLTSVHFEDKKGVAINKGTLKSNAHRPVNIDFENTIKKLAEKIRINLAISDSDQMTKSRLISGSK